MAARCDVCGYHLEPEGEGFVCLNCAYEALKRIASMKLADLRSPITAKNCLNLARLTIGWEPYR